MQAHSVGMHETREAPQKPLLKMCRKWKMYITNRKQPCLLKRTLRPKMVTLIGSDSKNTLVSKTAWAFRWTGSRAENRLLCRSTREPFFARTLFCRKIGAEYVLLYRRFSVYAMRGGAQLVHSVDSSAKAIELTDKNIELNFSWRYTPPLCRGCF